MADKQWIKHGDLVFGPAAVYVSMQPGMIAYVEEEARKYGTHPVNILHGALVMRQELPKALKEIREAKKEKKHGRKNRTASKKIRTLRSR